MRMMIKMMVTMEMVRYNDAMRIMIKIMITMEMVRYNDATVDKEDSRNYFGEYERVTRSHRGSP